MAFMKTPKLLTMREIAALDLFLLVSIKSVFHWANLFARREAKTRIQQRDWLAKKFAASSTNHVAGFLFSLRVARTNSPSGKQALGSHFFNLLT